MFLGAHEWPQGLYGDLAGAASNQRKLPNHSNVDVFVSILKAIPLLDSTVQDFYVSNLGSSQEPPIAMQMKISWV